MMHWVLDYLVKFRFKLKNQVGSKVSCPKKEENYFVITLAHCLTIHSP